jgi:hypothetical protein
MNEPDPFEPYERYAGITVIILCILGALILLAIEFHIIKP